MRQSEPLFLPSGTLVRHYRIRRLVGAGGFGAVYEADVISPTGQTVALKETHEAGTLHAYQREWTVLRTLRHPNLPIYHEVFAEAGRGYLVMEFVSGQDLSAVLAQGHTLTEAQVLGYALQLCDVLTYVHRQQPAILHRDIKPANIRITPEGLLKLVDFGLVKRGDQATQTALRGTGSPAYAPIEQYGGAESTDVRSDIYSLGATLYHLLTGQEPPSAGLQISERQDPLVWPHIATQQQVSFAVSQAIVTAMALRKDDRYPDSLHFKHALLSSNARPRTASVPGVPPSTTAATVMLTPVSAPAPAVTRRPPPRQSVSSSRPVPSLLPSSSPLNRKPVRRWSKCITGWIRWMLGTTIAWIVGLLASAVAVGVITLMVTPFSFPEVLKGILVLGTVGLVVGGSLGRAQRVWLTRRVALQWWGRATAIGWAVGVPIGMFSLAVVGFKWGIVAAGAAVGLSVGSASGCTQWFVLQRVRVRRAAWWLLATILSWTLAGTLTAAWYEHLVSGSQGMTGGGWALGSSIVVVCLMAQGVLGLIIRWVVQLDD